MIKANELVWKIKKEHLYETTVEFETSVLYHDLCFEVYAACYPMWTACLCSKGYRIWRNETTSNAKAKAACQTHYQQMVESMVDMGHLKFLIEEAVSFGFKRGYHYQPELWRYENAMETAIEVFLKTIEQERKG